MSVVNGPWNRHRQTVALVVIILGMAMIQLHWIHADVRPLLHGDSYAYLAGLHEFLARVDLTDPADVWQRLGRMAHGGRPPLYQLMTTPFVLTSSGADAPLFVNLFFLVLLMVSTYAAGRLTFSGRVGLLSAFLVASYGPVFRTVRQYLPYFALVACSALALWLLLVLLRERSLRAAWWLAAASAFGMLIHPRFLHVMALPILVGAIYTLVAAARARPPAGDTAGPPSSARCGWRTLLFAGLLPAGLVAMAFVSSWYLTWGQKLIEMQRVLQSSELVESRGFEKVRIGFEHVPADFWWYLRTSPAALSSVLVAFIVVGLLSALVPWRMETGIHVAVLTCGYFVQAVDRSLSWGYMAPVLPSAGILTAIGLARLRPGWLRHACITAVVAVAVFNVAAMTFDVGPRGTRMLAALRLPAHDGAYCANNVLCATPPTTRYRDWPFEAIIGAVARDMMVEGRRDALILLVRDSGMEGARFAYHLRRDHPSLNVHAVGEGVPTWGSPYSLAALLRGDYLLYPEVLAGSAPDRLYQEASVKFLASPPQRFRDTHRVLAQFETPAGHRAKLLKRTAQLTYLEAEEAIAALDLPQRFKTSGDQILVSLAQAEGRL